VQNRQVLLKSRPSGVAQSDNFEIRETAVDPLQDGQILVRNHYLSVEPAMRGWIADQGNYSAPVPIGGVMRSLASGEIIESKHPDYKAGDFVSGWFGWQDYAAAGADQIVQRTNAAELSQSLGVLGMNGVTAYLAMTDIGAPKAGETAVVSTAAGSVGSAAGQIARIFGCRTVGIAGGPKKAKLCVDEFGFDVGLDYREPNLSERIAAACPKGVDVYYDNTAGAISDAVLPHLAVNARVVICGTASVASWENWPVGPRVERHLLVKRARMQGFVMFDHMHRFGEAVAKLREWIKDGRLRYREEILQGIAECPDALAGLYRGDNEGKRLIKLV
jgi:NADPH-dependent curcumin reductase